ncbi:MAG: sulfatase-like hydrolase/transferase, partial [Planctomycetaceae bacterium]|nr:sulfatase-like hydrolase/transferase [Planctomycetaceae bacterium]
SWPGEIDRGKRSDAMVSWIDILPTLLDVAGDQNPEEIDGRSFLPVLKGDRTDHRNQIFTTHSGDGNNNVFPIRAVQTSDGWKYIRNLHPEFRFRSHVTNTAKDNGYWPSWMDAATRDDNAKGLIRKYQNRPAEELYNVNLDPWEQKNLIAEGNQQSRLADLRRRLDSWMQETGDTKTIFGEPQLVPGDKPNVITVFIDDMGWSDLSCYGGKQATTENIDRLAREGLRFT